jgi:hypothetical protein
MPRVNIKNKHRIIKLLSLKKEKAEIKMQKLKKINEW